MGLDARLVLALASVGLALALLAAVLGIACGDAGDQGRIVYVTCPSVSECTFVSINPDGSERESLFSLDVPEGEVPLLPQCSPNGKEIVYFLGREDKSSIFRASLDDGDITDLTPSLHAVDPAWSPDGRIVFSATPPGQPAHPQLWVMNADGSEAHPLTNNEDVNLVAAWSPDGSRIAYTSTATATSGTLDAADIWVIDSDGSQTLPLVTGPSHDRQPAWAPDGQTIAFTRVELPTDVVGGGGVGGQIFLADASGQNIRPLTSDALRKFLPRWSPDGEEIVFSTAPEFREPFGERDRRFQIYIINADGSGQQQITDEPNGAHFATWCP
jgi:Tol biopolymer transport system component